MGFVLTVPFLEFFHCSGFVEQPQFYTPKKVFKVKNAFKAQNATYGIGRLCAFVKPIQSPLAIQLNGCRDGEWVVRTEFLDEFSVAGAAAIGDDNEVKRPFFRAVSL